MVNIQESVIQALLFNQLEYFSNWLTLFTVDMLFYKEVYGGNI